MKNSRTKKHIFYLQADCHGVAASASGGNKEELIFFVTKQEPPRLINEITEEEVMKRGESSI